MSNEKVKSSNLELEEKVAVGAVFLLAGWFLWQFLGKDNGAMQLATNDTGVLQEETSRVRLFDQEGAAVPIDTNVSGARIAAPELIEQTTVSEPATHEPIRTAEKNRYSTDTASSVSVTKPLASVGEQSKSTIDIVPEPIGVTAEKAKQPELPVSPDPVKKSMEAVTPVVVTPTIRPITGDLSKGLLRLSGTGKPGSHLQLLLNGRKASNIPVDTQGNWHYGSNLESGNYSVQVLSTEFSDSVGVQSALTRVTIPKLKESSPPKQVVAPKVNRVLPQEAVTKRPVINKEIVTTYKPQVRVPDRVIDTAKVLTAKKAEIKRGVGRQKLNDRFYKVKPGDTLNKLGRRFNVSLRSLIVANSVADKDQIEVGQLLIIPGRYPGGTVGN